MSKKGLVTIVGIFGLALMAAISLPAASANATDGQGGHGKMDMKKRVEAEPSNLEKIHSMHLPMVSKSIEKAIKAIESGDKEAALVELHKAQKMLAVINAGIAKPKFANVRCPIMGSPINPEKVTEALTRDYKGRKIAFCCGRCPGQWDGLSDAGKKAKLTKVMPKPMENHPEGKH